MCECVFVCECVLAFTYKVHIHLNARMLVCKREFMCLCVQAMYLSFMSSFNSMNSVHIQLR